MPQDLDGPASKEAGAPDETVEVTPAMIDAGESAFYREADTGWDWPGAIAVRRMVSLILSAAIKPSDIRPHQEQKPQ